MRAEKLLEFQNSGDRFSLLIQCGEEVRDLPLLEVDPRKDRFLTIAESLTRIGRFDPNTGILEQECHILSKRGRYLIVHYKQLKLLDGELLQEPLIEREEESIYYIGGLLLNWNLVNVPNPRCLKKCEDTARKGGLGLKIIKHKDKGDYHLVPRYVIGRKNTNVQS